MPMEFNVPDSLTFTALDQKMLHLESIVTQMSNFLSQSRPSALPPLIYEGINQLSGLMAQTHKQINALEEERRSLRALAQVAQYVNSTLELDDVLQIVMDTIIRITRAERGFLMLRNDSGELAIRVARNWEQATIDPSEFAISRTVIYRVANEGTPVLTTNAQEDPRFTGQQSVIAYNLRSILCVPLKAKDSVIGVIFADNRIRTGLFTQKDLTMLADFANQAAVAIENARLFASVKQTLAEVTELKNLMDNIFSSITSGVLTADVGQRILMCNRSAEMILGRNAPQILGRELDDVVPPLEDMLQPYIERVRQTDQPMIGLEGRPVFPPRGPMDLRFSLSPLKDAQQETYGVAIVFEDLTEKKQLEAQRRLFERMVSPAVIAQLDPDSLQLGGQRSQITVLFADIHGFTSYSESVNPEELVSILNSYLAGAAEAVLSESGTIDKFLGDGIMAWFNAPVQQPDHTLRAVRAALGIRQRVLELHQVLPPSRQLTFGIGIHVGDAILGLVGTEKRLDYTAIGDCVNTAKRVEENAGSSQILITESAYQLVADQVIATPVEPISAKGKREPVPVYNLVGLK